MLKKRNIFFADAVKAIGKTRTQVKREKNEKILKRRFIQLGGGFELPETNSPEFKRNKKKLLRSGSILRIERETKFKEDDLIGELDMDKVIN